MANLFCDSLLQRVSQQRCSQQIVFSHQSQILLKNSGLESTSQQKDLLLFPFTGGLKLGGYISPVVCESLPL